MAINFGRIRIAAGRRRFALPGLAMALALALTSVSSDVPAASAGKKAPPLKFEDARMKIEFNSTDQDVGVQFFIDVDSWQSVRIFNPAGKLILDARAKGDLLKLGGGTETFLESNEPTLDELSLDQFFALFPEGTYRFVGRTPDGESIVGETVFRHRIPAGPELVLPVTNGDECARNVAAPVAISWNPVTKDLNGNPIRIKSYEVVIEHRNLNFDVTMAAKFGTTLTVPAELLDPGTRYDFEVLAIAANGNQTITAACFVTAT